MSLQLISRSPDLKKLRDEGYEIEIRSNHLLIHSVPYVNIHRQALIGTLVSELTLNGDVATQPSTHIAYFIGDHPCDHSGIEIEQIKHNVGLQNLGADVIVNRAFSNKPKEGAYRDYYHKMARYIEIIASPAKRIEPNLTARTFKVIDNVESDSPFVYMDTASSRAGIAGIAERLALSKIAIIGLGGTGSYILDLIAKTPVKEIHLFDADIFMQHNAFRAPGAASITDLTNKLSKVEYYKNIYSRIHKGIVTHKTFVSLENVHDLKAFDFVFLSIDRGVSKQAIFEFLQQNNIPFVDVGMGIQIVDGTNEIIGICRVTTSSTLKTDHVSNRVSFADTNDDLYTQNIQIADLNALNATLAVIKWKKLFRFYQDMEQEHNSTYSINVNLLTSADKL